jgi:hypothetical protein
MATRLLLNPRTYEVVAELTPGERVVIKDPWLMRKAAFNGITVPRGFDRDFDNVGRCRVYPGDYPAIFAKAFEEVWYRHGLIQGGYQWVDAKDYTNAVDEKEKRRQKILKDVLGDLYISPDKKRKVDSEENPSQTKEVETEKVESQIKG